MGQLNWSSELPWCILLHYILYEGNRTALDTSLGKDSLARLAGFKESRANAINMELEYHIKCHNLISYHEPLYLAYLKYLKYRDMLHIVKYIRFKYHDMS